MVDARSRFAAPFTYSTALLSNGQYNVGVSEVGSGCSELGGIAITRSAADETRDADGFYIYLRDLDNGLVWSAGYQPTRVVPSRYSLRNDSNRVEITRLDHDIECQLTVSVSPRYNFEIRGLSADEFWDGRTADRTYQLPGMGAGFAGSRS